MGSRQRVLITDADELDYPVTLDLLERAGIEGTYLDSRDREAILEGAQGCQGIILGYATLDAGMIQALPDLRAVTTMSAGFDMIDIEAAEARGIIVCTVPSAATKDVATHAFAGMLSLIRELPQSHAATRAGDWTGNGLPVPPRVSELTLGLIGFGRIAQYLATIAAPAFEDIIAFDPFIPEDEWPGYARRVKLADLLAISNVVSLHTPLTQETRNMLDADAIAEMSVGSYVINVSRGALIDERALHAALGSGQIAGAMLDVLETEPAPVDHPLVVHPSTIVTPHSAYRSTVSLRDYVALPARNMIACLQGGTPETPLNPRS